MVVELTATGSILSVICVHDTVICISSRKQQCIQRARWRLYVAADGLTTADSVVCVI